MDRSMTLDSAQELGAIGGFSDVAEQLGSIVADRRQAAAEQRPPTAGSGPLHGSHGGATRGHAAAHDGGHEAGWKLSSSHSRWRPAKALDTAPMPASGTAGAATGTAAGSRAATTANRSSYDGGSRGGAGSVDAVKPPPPDIAIHVCDDVRRIRRDFVCNRELLLSHMRYFESYLTGLTSDDDIDISVHCDIDVFTWLAEYMQDTCKAKSLEVGIVVPILISSHFLQMGRLVDECLAFMKRSINQVLRLPVDLTCLSTELVRRLAKLFTEEELEQVRDRRDRLASRLYAHKLEELYNGDEQLEMDPHGGGVDEDEESEGTLEAAGGTGGEESSNAARVRGFAGTPSSFDERKASWYCFDPLPEHCQPSQQVGRCPGLERRRRLRKGIRSTKLGSRGSGSTTGSRADLGCSETPPAESCTTAAAEPDLSNSVPCQAPEGTVTFFDLDPPASVPKNWKPDWKMDMLREDDRRRMDELSERIHLRRAAVEDARADALGVLDFTAAGRRSLSWLGDASAVAAARHDALMRRRRGAARPAGASGDARRPAAARERTASRARKP